MDNKEKKEITFEDIKKANEHITKVDVKGKAYAEVNQRIKAFRMLYPMGCIETEIVSLRDGVCIMKAHVYDERGHKLGTGTAYEKEGSTFINKTSYIENCETSAVGRALGMAGFGIDVSVASYEEVMNAMNNQKEVKYVTAQQIKDVRNKLTDMDATVDKLCERYDIYELEQMNADQYIHFCNGYEKWKAGKEA